MSLAEHMIKTADGIGLLLDWLGEGGKVVPQKVADHRARICFKCDYNVSPRWWEKSKTKIAHWIRAQLEIKHDMKLRAAHEDDLNMCKICGCLTKLKVWVPASHILEHTSVKTMREFPEWCWIPREAK